MEAALSDIRETLRSVTIISGEDPSYLEERYAASSMRDSLAALRKAVEQQIILDEESWTRLSGLATSIVAIGTILLIAFAWFQVRVSADFRRQAVVLDEERHKLEDRDWVKTNLAELSSNLQNIKNQDMFAETIMRELTPLIGGHVGIYYAAARQDDDSFVL